ncbi:MAG: hypothetical protein ACJAYU_001163, partial [Bradymonadia bacterium]
MAAQTRFVRALKLTVALSVFLAGVALSAQPEPEIPEGSAAEGSAAEEVADGSGTAEAERGEEGSGGAEQAEPEGSGEVSEAEPAQEPDPVEERLSPEQAAAEFIAATVVSHAELLIPRSRDPRLTLLRAGGANAEVADVLGVELIELTAPDSLTEIRASLDEARTSLLVEADRLSAETSVFADRANALFDQLLGLETAHPFLAFQLSAAQHLASEKATERDTIRAESVFATAAVAYADARLQVLETEVSAEIADQLEEANSEIEADQLRQEQELRASQALT